MVRVQTAIISILTLAACGEETTPQDGIDSEIQEVCDAYIACSADELPEVTAMLEAEFSEEGTCHLNAAESLHCGALCRKGLDRLGMEEASGPACDSDALDGVDLPRFLPFGPGGPPCHRDCVADVGPQTDPQTVVCTISISTPTDRSSYTLDRTIPRCGTGSDPVTGACWSAITDPTQMDPTCVDEGWNLQFFVEFDGNPPVGEYELMAFCPLSGHKAVDCPNLP